MFPSDAYSEPIPKKSISDVLLNSECASLPATSKAWLTTDAAGHMCFPEYLSSEYCNIPFKRLSLEKLKLIHR